MEPCSEKNDASGFPGMFLTAGKSQGKPAEFLGQRRGEDEVLSRPRPGRDPAPPPMSPGFGGTARHAAACFLLPLYSEAGLLCKW